MQPFKEMRLSFGITRKGDGGNYNAVEEVKIYELIYVCLALLIVLVEHSGL